MSDKINYTPIKTIRSHVGYGRFLQECSEIPVRYIPRDPAIRTPYAHSPEWPVWLHNDGHEVVALETAHKKYQIFKIAE